MSDFGERIKNNQEKRQDHRENRKDRLKRQLVLTPQDKNGRREVTRLIKCIQKRINDLVTYIIFTILIELY